MLTQCQQCKKTYSTEIRVLCYSNQQRLCPHCEEMLGKLKHLGKNFIASNKQQSYRKPRKLRWQLGVIFCLSLLLIQVYFFEKDQLSQNANTRVWLQKICLSLNCHLDDYKNTDDFEIMYHDFKDTGKQYYLFQVVFSNQGQFNQNYPDIKLNLLSFKDEIFAQRTFSVIEYLETERRNKLITPSKTVEISFKIAMPKQKVGGYTFELI